MSTEVFQRIAVVGAGSWGTALAATARRAGREVVLWGRDTGLAERIASDGRNDAYLPGIELPRGIETSADISQIGHADAVLLVTPSPTLREIARQMRPHLRPGVPVALCAKGIEIGTGMLLSEAAQQELPGHPIGALSGPTFAAEVARGFPTAVTIAFAFSYDDRLAPHTSTAARLAFSMSSETFRPYISDDLTGVEIGGAIKNVIAIACGMMTGAGFAENTRAALITRGMDEMKRLAEVLGGRRETVTGLSGAGDLTLTCSSTTSRNMSLGIQLGRGLPRARCFDGRQVVVEGEVNAISVHDLAERTRTHLPICEAVNAVLHRGAAIGETFAALWSAPLQGESATLRVLLDHPADPRAVRAFADSIGNGNGEDAA